MRGAGRVAGGVLLSAGVLYLGFGVDRTDFASLFLAFSVAFLGYLFVVAVRDDNATVPYWIALGIVLRLVLIFAFPLLSDDVYRFIWDGRLVAGGENPFVHLPAHYLDAQYQVPGLSQELFDRLNSPDYHSIYPPLAQAVFTVAAWISPNSWYGAAVVMKLFLFLAELGSLAMFVKLLTTFGLPRFRLLYYWLNPLIITEIVGNIHFEGMMICFLLLSLHWLTRSKYGGAAGAMSLSIASKLLPLMLLPFLLRRLWKHQFWVFFIVLGGATVLLFLPLLAGSGDVIGGFGGSVELYFRKFEFNASLYYLARAYGYYELGWNQIARFGPLLAKISVALILIAALGDRTTDWRSLPGLWLAAFVLYLLCATTVHPWYLSIPIALCCFTRWRFPLLWSYLVMLTYTSYIDLPYEENLWLVAAEYIAVLVFFIAERRKK